MDIYWGSSSFLGRRLCGSFRDKYFPSDPVLWDSLHLFIDPPTYAHMLCFRVWAASPGRTPVSPRVSKTRPHTELHTRAHHTNRPPSLPFTTTQLLCDTTLDNCPPELRYYHHPCRQILISSITGLIPPASWYPNHYPSRPQTRGVSD